jgi:hypothetical protein
LTLAHQNNSLSCDEQPLAAIIMAICLKELVALCDATVVQYVQFATAKKHCSFWDNRPPVGPT